MDRQMYHYATVSKALQELAEKGFTTDFNLEEERIAHNADDFTIEHIYRYEGESDPGDESTVYGIRSAKGEKGVFVVGPGGDENDAAKRLLDMSIRGRIEQQ
ncbi:hypothetical protein AM493_04310 [Flavobacterium akiainvivens]|uniref:Phosphoribosylpyrophosphate synthetase n=1 Tax=Flavobacterium akiainvivens TaxID=1202724 RepID=A0A0M9VHA0_9FLAO|nr:hypothetical protein [Flavobacterium akiainvivens]KOS05339.1 hypothetical protein AM493_04310 [Flavobacterium akiainvivens]SFQ76695.1 hypothetical protein SAMN05444144_12416 [Flavobacterium akiainvivens]